MPLFSESDWTKVGGNGGGVSVGPRALGKVSIDVTGGTVNVKKDSDQRVKTLRYAGAGASIGGSIVPSIINFAMDMPSGSASSDRIYKTYRSGRSLEYNEMRGTFLLITAGGDVGVGYNFSGMFVGGMGTPTPAFVGTFILYMGTARAFIPMSGPTATLLAGNIGAGFAFGVIG